MENELFSFLCFLKNFKIWRYLVIAPNPSIKIYQTHPNYKFIQTLSLSKNNMAQNKSIIMDLIDDILKH